MCTDRMQPVFMAEAEFQWRGKSRLSSFRATSALATPEARRQMVDGFKDKVSTFRELLIGISTLLDEFRLLIRVKGIF